MPTSTLVSLRQKIIKKLYAPRWPIISISATGGSAITITDTIWTVALQDVSPINAWIYCYTAGGWAVGDIGRATNATGSTLYVATAKTDGSALGTPTAAFEYEIHYKFHPVRVHEKINEILENLKHDVWDPLTLVTDGNTQTSGVANWADTNATSTKQATGTGVQFGTQCLRVTNAAANGYTQSASMYLRPGERVFVAALVQIVSGTSPDATLQFYDVTNSAVVDSGTVGTLFRGNALIAFETNVPATSAEQAVRLVGTAADSVIDWNFVCVYPVRRRQFALSSAFDWPEDFKNIYYLEVGDGITVGNSSNAYNAWEHVLRKWGEGSVFRNDTADVPYRIERRDAKNINKVLFVKGRVDYGTFTTTGATADAETTVAPDDIVVDLVYAALLDEWATELRDNDQLEEAQKKEEKAMRVRVDLGPRMQEFYKPTATITGTIRSGEPN